MTVVVCDASPLIILAKLDRLELVGKLFGSLADGVDGNVEIVVLQCVVDEVLSERAGIVERQRLDQVFETGAKVVKFAESDFVAKSLSGCDQSVLTFSVRNSVDWLVVDERLLRRIAMQQGLAVAGILGMLVECANRGIISRADARADLEDAVSKHQLRISVALYQRVMQELEE